MSLKALLQYFYNNNKCVRNAFQKVSLVKSSLNSTKKVNVRLGIPSADPKFGKYGKPLCFAAALSVLSWLGFSDEDEQKESELIMTLKRAVLCTQREQYDQAEQMLHLALRIAQQQQNAQGQLYCYDLMANLALDRLELDKAEKLFIQVLHLLLGGGMDRDNLKVIHISLKLARISQLKADVEHADVGYKWCLTNIEGQKHNSVDARMLYGIIQDWYAQFLLDIGKVKESLRHLQEAYEACKDTVGQESEQSMLLLNDLATTSFRAGDLKGAENYMKEAITIGRKVEDKTHLGVLVANLGLILLERGVASEAEKYCKEAWRLGKRYDNNESVEQANYCFDQIKLNLKK